MSKSDQFAVPADIPVTSATKPPRPLPLRIASWGCGGFVLIVVLLIFVSWARLTTAKQQPVDQQKTLQSLAGVPVYPGSKFDEDLTRDSRGALAATDLLDNYKMKTSIGLRTADDPKEVIRFYDSKMAGFGFIKTTLGGGNKDGASYTSPDATVVVQVDREAGEDNRLVILRFDRQSRTVLSQPTNVVTPEDFKKAAREAEQKKKQPEQQKAVPQK